MKPVYWLAVLPFIGILGGIFFTNTVTPYVLGMPFILFWIVVWVVITSGIMAVINKFDDVNREGDSR